MNMSAETDVKTEIDSDKKITELQEKLNYQIEESKKAFQKRDELKNKLEEIEKKKLEETSEYKELYSQTELKLKETEERLKTLAEVEEKFKAVETERRTELIERLQDEDLKEFANSITDLNSLKKYVDLSITKLSKQSVNQSKAGKTVIDSNKTWDDYSDNELEDLSKNNPDYYSKLHKQKYRR
jgi:DNA repair exonuclease SbcCD ATPase subunit